MKKRAFFALAALSLATPALAQFGGRRRGGPPDGKGGPREQNGFEVTLHELHEDLKLSPEQEKAWQSYERKLRALVDDQRRERGRLSEAVELPKRIDRIVDVARNRLTAVEDAAEAAKALYSGLTAEQQAAANPRLANVMALSVAAR